MDDKTNIIINLNNFFTMKSEYSNRLDLFVHDFTDAFILGTHNIITDPNVISFIFKIQIPKQLSNVVLTLLTQAKYKVSCVSFFDDAKEKKDKIDDNNWYYYKVFVNRK